MKPADLLHPLCSALLAVAAVYATVRGVLPGLSLCVVGICDVYLLTMLAIVSIMQSTRQWARVMPSRVAGVFFVAGMLIAFVFGYANLYVASRGVVHQSFKIVAGRQGAAVEPGRFEVLQEPRDAVYFSVVTMSTVGYGDFFPANEAARRIVVWEIGSGLLVLIVVFPLLVSRLAVHADLAADASETGDK